MTFYYPSLGQSRILYDSDRSSASSADDADVTGWNKAAKFIVAVQIYIATNNARSQSYDLQWRNVTDGGSFADLGATGELKYAATSAVLVNETAVISTEKRNTTTHGTWMNGWEVVNTYATANYTLSANYYTEFQFAIDPADAHNNDQYEFQLVNASTGVAVGTCAAAITIAAAYIDLAGAITTKSASVTSVLMAWALLGSIISTTFSIGSGSLAQLLLGSINSIANSFGSVSLLRSITGSIKSASNLAASASSAIALIGGILIQSELAAILEISNVVAAGYRSIVGFWHGGLGAIPAQVVDLSGSIITASTSAGTLGLSKLLIGSITTASALVGTLSNSISLVGSIASVSSLSAYLTRSINIAGSILTQSTLIGNLLIGTVTLTGSIVSTSISTGQLSAQWALRGTISTASTLSATLSAAWALLGSITTKSTIATSLSVFRGIVGSITTTSVLVGDLFVARLIAIAGTIYTQSALAGATLVQMLLSGLITTKSSISLNLSMVRALVGSIITSSKLSFAKVSINPYIPKTTSAKIQLHCHTTASDGNETAEQRMIRYRDAGYDALAITDHDIYTPDPGVEGIVFIEGAEIGSPYHHLHFTGVTPTVLAHPSATGVPSSWVGFIEIFNHLVNAEWGYPQAFNEQCFDTYLSQGDYPLYCIAADDTHAEGEYTKSWVMVFVDTIDYENIMTQLQAGNFYAANGLLADGISLEIEAPIGGNYIKVDVDYLSNILFIGKNGFVYQTSNNTLSAIYYIDGTEGYIRIKATKISGDAIKKNAWSQPIFVNGGFNLNVGRSLTGLILAASSLSATVTNLVDLYGQIVAKSALAASQSIWRGLSGAVTIGSVLVGQATNTIRLIGSITTRSILVTSSNIITGLIGSISTKTTSAGSLTLGLIQLIGSITTQASVAAFSSVSILMEGLISTRSAISAQATNTIRLIASILTNSSLAAYLTNYRPLAGSILSQSRLAGSITLSLGLAGLIQVKSSVSAIATNTIQLAGQILSQAVTQADLFIQALLTQIAGNIITTTSIAGAAINDILLAGVVSTCSELSNSLFSIYRYIKEEFSSLITKRILKSSVVTKAQSAVEKIFKDDSKL